MTSCTASVAVDAFYVPLRGVGQQESPKAAPPLTDKLTRWTAKGKIAGPVESCDQSDDYKMAGENAKARQEANDLEAGWREEAPPRVHASDKAAVQRFKAGRTGATC